MKTFLSICFLLAFVGLLLIGCSDKSITPVETTGVNDNPLVLQKETGPGAWIIRHDEEMAWGFYDKETGLMLLLGVNDFDIFCNNPVGGADIISIKDIYLPNADPNLRRIIMLQKGTDFTANVWQTDQWPDDFCGFVNTELPFVTGTANVTYTDNDVYAWAQDNPNSNSFGNKANGTLFDKSGKKYNLNFVYRVIWDPGKDITLNEVLKIQLTPTGK